MNISIEVCIREGQSTTDKGNILEELAVEILRNQQYTPVQKIRVTGTEIDVLARHKINNDLILVECKAWDTSLPADVISKLYGNAFFLEASAGWLMTTGPLSKDAEGRRIEWENRTDAQRGKLSFYTSDRIIQLLQDAHIIVNPNGIAEKVNREFKISSNVTLMLIQGAMYWLMPVVYDSSEFVSSLLVFNAKSGERISQKETLDEIKNYKNSYNSYQWLSSTQVDTKYVEQINQEYNSIVPVISGDDWRDYRPARPLDFVGRKTLINDIFLFFDSVNTGSSSTRLFSIKAPSGMGKSSVVLKIASLVKSRNYSKKYFVYAVDVRTAMSSRYVEMALKACFASADKEGFTDVSIRSVNSSNIAEYMNSISLQKTFEYLKQQSRTIILIFDQFEELFSKKELYSLFDNFRLMSNIVDSMSGQLILGFAWKTDLTIPAEHPAYYMWSNLSDRRKEFELQQFKIPEIKSAINIFGRQLGERVNPILSNYLTKQCQGYPWLLKKLCIHVFNLIVEGNSQDSVIGQRLNIVDLFERDMSGLTPEQHACLVEIAKNSPADYFYIDGIYGNNIIQALINNRIVIRRASKLTLYWDIFRDYVLNKIIPTLLLDYIPQMQSFSAANTLKCLLIEKNISAEALACKLYINIATINNIMIDLVMFGIAKKENGIISLLYFTEEELESQLQFFFRKHVLYEKMLTSERDGFSYSTFSKVFNDYYADSKLNEKTKTLYCRKLYSWFIDLRLFAEIDGKSFVLSSNSSKTVSFLLSNWQRRSKYQDRNAILFWGETSPEKMEEVYGILVSGTLSYQTLKSKGYRNAIELLSVSKAIKMTDDMITLAKDINEIYAYITSSDTINFVRQLMHDNQLIKGVDVGHALNDRFHRNWTLSSKIRYGNALLRWARHLSTLGMN